MTTNTPLSIGEFVYERGDDGAWYELEPAGDDTYWVGPPLDDPQLIAALDEIERLVRLCESARSSGSSSG